MRSFFEVRPSTRVLNETENVPLVAQENAMKCIVLVRGSSLLRQLLLALNIDTLPVTISTGCHMSKYSIGIHGTDKLPHR